MGSDHSVSKTLIKNLSREHSEEWVLVRPGVLDTQKCALSHRTRTWAPRLATV